MQPTKIVVLVAALMLAAACGGSDDVRSGDDPTEQDDDDRTDVEEPADESGGPPPSGHPLQFEVMDHFGVSRAEAGCIISWLEDYAGSLDDVPELIQTEMGDNAYLDCAYDTGASDSGVDMSGGDVYVVREYCRIRESGLTIGDRTQYSVEYWVEYSNGTDELVSMDSTETPPAC